MVDPFCDRDGDGHATCLWRPRTKEGGISECRQMVKVAARTTASVSLQHQSMACPSKTGFDGFTSTAGAHGAWHEKTFAVSGSIL
jgi:hypothetical protein